MNLSCVFFVTKYGDVIVSKDYCFDGILSKVAPDFRHRVLNGLNDDDEDDSDDEDECDTERLLPDEQVTRAMLFLTGQILMLHRFPLLSYVHSLNPNSFPCQLPRT